MHHKTALRALLVSAVMVAMMLACADSASAQSNNTADLMSFNRYIPCELYKVGYDVNASFAFTSQPLGRSWSTLLYHWQSLRGNQQWQEVVLTRKPLRNRWGFGTAIDRWQGEANDLVVTPFVEYTSKHVALSATSPLGNARGTAFGLVLTMGDHHFAFATISPGSAPAWGLSWHNHAKHTMRFDVAYQDDTWKTRLGRALDDHWGFEFRLVSRGRSHTLGFGVSFAH